VRLFKRFVLMPQGSNPTPLAGWRDRSSEKLPSAQTTLSNVTPLQVFHRFGCSTASGVPKRLEASRPVPRNFQLGHL
jgi:hypothetical protein